ncbi:unnamed protein product [Peronospora belbahrii]|uniref:Uncharacterized protein n=1 Tax=Peronospora belbahrii TaxID=622444 RepID=A0ABN8D2M4_9STRA|nr:unnamed protein product [Peronospora belbahrii]
MNRRQTPKWVPPGRYTSWLGPFRPAKARTIPPSGGVCGTESFRPPPSPGCPVTPNLEKHQKLQQYPTAQSAAKPDPSGTLSRKSS